MNEHVILVDERNQRIGTAPKSTVHSTTTPLHRGFSVFVLNARGELLLQQRAATKKLGRWFGRTAAAAIRLTVKPTKPGPGGG